MRIPIFLSLYLLTGLFAMSQDIESENSEAEEEVFRRHKIGVMIGHSHVSQGVVEEGRKFRILSSWEVGYSYAFNRKWRIAFNVDIILEDFEVEKLSDTSDDEGIILREKPIAPAIMAGFQATKHSAFFLGAGIEFASGESFALTRFTYEWGTEINEKWELVIPLTYDLRWNAYDIWNIAIGVSRSF